MQSELKPCPFCGGEAERVDIEDGDNAGGSFVHCTVCDASGNVEFEFKENFISNWNRRAALSNQERAVEVGQAPRADLRVDADFRTLVGMLLGTIQRHRRWLKSSLSSDEVIEFDNAVDAVRAAWDQTPPPQTMEAGRSALVDVPVEPEYWTSHNNFENMLGKGVTDERGGVVWDFALQAWVNADVPLYASQPIPHREGEDSAEVLRSALQRISELTPAKANAKDARDLHHTVKAIADVALAATRSASATRAKGCAE
jgi:Lar family restriction alleviation protein